MKNAAITLLLLLTASSLTSCVGYIRFRVDEPVPPASLQALEVGGADLSRCLAALGAPNRVFEYRGDGMALLWSWQDTDDWSVDVSFPVSDSVNANFDLDLTFLERPGCVLFFGPDLILAGWRAGMIGDVLPRRVRPAAVE